VVKKEKSPHLLNSSSFFGCCCIIAFTGSIGFATNWFKGTVQDTPFGNSTPFLIIMLTSMGLGIIAFCIFVLMISIKLVKGDKSKKEIRNKKSNFFQSIFKLCLNLAFFPLILLYRSSGLKELKEKINVEKFQHLYLANDIKQTMLGYFIL
jgi:magnesium-transporting ATPase (P-type)